MTTESGADILVAFDDHCDLLITGVSFRRQLAKAAESFLTDNPDLSSWMARPVDARLIELSRRPGTWPFVLFALVGGWCRSDLEFLFVKNFGHNAGRSTAIMHADDVDALRDAASRIEYSDAQFKMLLGAMIPLVIAGFGVPLHRITCDDLDGLESFIQSNPRLTPTMRRCRRAQAFALRQLMFQAHFIDAPPTRLREGGPATRTARMAVVGAPEIRRSILAYLETRAVVVRPKTLDKLTSTLGIFGEYICKEFPALTSLSQLERRHVESFLTWTATRECRRPQDGSRQVGPFVTAHAAFTLRNFLDDIAAWGWAEAPQRRLVFSTDIPRQPEMLPRGLPPDVDRAIMTAVQQLADPFARAGITVLRHTGIRIGELLDLELDCVSDYGPSGTWMRVPLGKLNDERAVPLDNIALEALDEWLAQRPSQRALSKQRDGKLCDFVFVERGHRLGPTRIQHGLSQAVADAGLVGTDSQPLRVVAHQLRHTWATELVNAGMSLQALMALLGHRTPEMTMRYARLSSPTLRAAYEEAMGKVAPRIPVAPAGRPAIPNRVGWLSAEMLKTRVAHGYCARELVAEACPYANVCETCPNFVTTAEFAPAIEAQLCDIHELRADAEGRGWVSEVHRHERVIVSLEGHLRRLSNNAPDGTPG